MTTENAKLLHESFKHLTTLSSATLLVIAAVATPDLFSSLPRMVAGLALTSLLMSNLISVFCMFTIANSTALDKYAMRLAMGLFMFGVICITFLAGYKASGAR